jgi:four helix bundle protein
MRHTDTLIYQRSMELIAVVRTVMDHLPPGFGFLADQLRRAASSIVLNFSEGFGKTSPRDRRRYFMIARGSAHEVAAAVDVAVALGGADKTATAGVTDLCDHLSAMLYRFR